MTAFRSLGARKDDTRGTSALEVRKDLAGLFTGVGVLPGSSSPLVEGTASFEYQVNAGTWVTSRGASDGVHLWGNDGPVTVATGVAPGGGLSRIDIIYALHPSDSENGDTDSEPVIDVAQGTAASSPVAPSLPTGALELARNTMTSTATSTASGGNTITQSATLARLVTPTANAESVTTVAATGGPYTSSARIADFGVISPAGYDRVVDMYAVVNTSGMSAGASWSAVVTSAGTSVLSNVEMSARFPFTSSVAVGGSVVLATTYALPAGTATSRPSLWVEELSGAGTLTVTSPSYLRVRVRPAATR